MIIHVQCTENKTYTIYVLKIHQAELTQAELTQGQVDSGANLTSGRVDLLPFTSYRINTVGFPDDIDQVGNPSIFIYYSSIDLK